MAAVALVTSVGLLGAACSEEKPPNLATPTFGGSTTTKPPKPYIAKYATQGACTVRGIDDPALQNEVECGTLTVPEDRQNPLEKNVELQVVVIKSTNPDKKPDPVMYLEGGPGGSALATLELWAIPPSPFLADRDIVIMDQRGTGYSSPRFNCNYELTTIGEDRVTLNAGEYLAEQVNAVKECFSRLDAAHGLENFSTIDAAADIEDLRKQLGYPQLNVFGVSYGTRLALQYMNDYPASVRSAVLDSNYPFEPHLVDQGPANAWRALKAVFDSCASIPSCDSKYPDLQGALTQVIEQLDAEPITFLTQKLNNDVVEYQFTGQDYVDQLFSYLYDSGAASAIPEAITVSKSDPEAGLMILQNAVGLSINATDDVERRPSFSNGLFYLLDCTEEVPFDDKATMDALSADIPEPMRTKFVTDRATIFDICSAWNLPSRELAKTSVEIPSLVLAGTFDPITPPAWSQLTASRLPNSTYVEVEGSGHGVFFSGDCARDLVVAFVNDPASAAGKSCPPVTNLG